MREFLPQVPTRFGRAEWCGAPGKLRKSGHSQWIVLRRPVARCVERLDGDAFVIALNQLLLEGRTLQIAFGQLTPLVVGGGREIVIESKLRGKHLTYAVSGKW